MDEIDLDVFKQRLRLTNEDSETMEQKLKALLLQNPYTLEEEMEFEGEEEMGSKDEDGMGFEGEEVMVSEGAQQSGLHQWGELKSMLHATDEELKSALRLVSAVEINGHWRIIDDLFIGRVLYCIVWRAKSMGLSFSSLDGDKVLRFCKYGFSPVLIRHCLELYASTTDGRVWELDTKRVCVELARWVIKSNGKRMEIKTFMDLWSYVGLPVSLDMLEEEILVEKHGDHAWVCLPSDHNGSNGNTLATVSKAFPPDLQNPSRSFNPRNKSRPNLDECDEMELDETEVDVFAQSLSNEDAGTMEQKLKTILLQNPYTLDEDMGFEVGQPSRLHRWDNLKSALHATDEELKSALRRVSAVEINGYWRIVDDYCIGRVLYFLLLKVESNRHCPFIPLDGNKVVKYLGDRWGYSPVLARHCLELYASTTDGMVWELDTKRVCVEHARRILRCSRKRLTLQEFMGHWIHITLPVSLDMLEGEILVEQDGDQSWIYLQSDHNTHTSVFGETQ